MTTSLNYYHAQRLCNALASPLYQKKDIPCLQKRDQSIRVKLDFPEKGSSYKSNVIPTMRQLSMRLRSREVLLTADTIFGLLICTSDADVVQFSE